MYNPLIDVESGGYGKRSLDPSFEFAEREVRRGFVRKVLGERCGWCTMLHAHMHPSTDISFTHATSLAVCSPSS